MNISWLTLRDLQYLSAVARFQHFGKAAEACHVSQPALSSQIKKIEDVLGVKVFDRTQRKVSITDIGESIVKQANVVLEEAEKIATLAKKNSEPLTGVFRLGAIASLGPYLFPHILVPMKKAHPLLDLRLKEGLTDNLLDDLKRGSLDGVILAKTFPTKGFSIFSLFHEPFKLLVPSKHPLADKSTIRAQDLNSKEMVLLEDGHCLRDQALDICPASRRGNLQEFHATSLETLRYMVANETGYTLIPILAIREDSQLKGLVKYRNIDGRGIGRDIILAGRENSSRIADLEALSKSLKKIMSPLKGLTIL